jgi:hypothetical protein
MTGFEMSLGIIRFVAETVEQHKKHGLSLNTKNIQKESPWPLVIERTVPTERPQLVGEVSANFCG